MSLGQSTFLGENEIARRIRNDADIHSTFQWENFLAQGIDAHFLARVVDLNSVQSLVKASDYWAQVNYNDPFEGTLTLPQNLSDVGIYSRRAFIYPQLTAWIKLPSLSLIGNETYIYYYFGFENGSAAFNGIASFQLVTSTTTTNWLTTTIGTRSGLTNLDINVAKPSDFNTAYHVYRVILTKNLALFFIDNRLRAVGVQCLEGSVINIANNVLPYSILLTPPMPSSLTTLIEISTNRTAVAPSSFAVPLSPYRFRVSDGKDIIPLSLSLYLQNNDVAFAGQTISSGSITSHPIPVFGYKEWELLIDANQDFTVQLQYLGLSGNWRTFDNYSSPTGSNRIHLLVDEPMILASVVITPSAYPMTINDALAVMVS